MAPPLILRIITDARQALRTNEQFIASNTLVGKSGLGMGADLAKGSKAAISSSLALEDALTAQAAKYRELSTSAALSAREQAKAAQLAEVAELKLARAQGLVVAGSRGVGTNAKTAERDLNKMTRGVLAGSGALSGLGRSLAFSSTGFIAASLGAAGVVSSIHDAEDLAKAQASLSVAIQHTGGDLAILGPQYEATAKAAAQFGVTEADATTGLARATVLTGNASAAQRAYQEALVISKATGKDFNSVLIAASKGQEGITTSLRRYGILVDSTSSGTEQFTQVMKRFGGQAAANTTATEKLHAAFTNALTTIGGALLPTFERLSASLADWLTKMNDSGKLQADANKALTVTKDLLGPVATGFKTLAGAIDQATKAWHGLNDAAGHVPGLQKVLGTLTKSFPSIVSDEVNRVKQLNSYIMGESPNVPVTTPQQYQQRLGITNNQILAGSPSASTMFGSAQPMKQFWKTFALTLKQQMAVAQAALTKSNQDDIAAAKQQIARIKTLLDQGRLHGPALLLALQMEASDLATIWNAEAAAAQKRAAAAAAARQKIIKQIQNAIDPIGLEVALSKAQSLGQNTTPQLKALLAAAYKGLAMAIANGNKQLVKQAYDQITSLKAAIKDAATNAVTLFTVPAKLALKLARDQALGIDVTADLEKERKALLRYIATHKKNIAAETDAYNQLAAINDQLTSQTQTAYGNYKKASIKALTAGEGLSAAQRRELEQRLSQVGPGGTVPGGGTGAAGYIIDPATGRPVQAGTHHHGGRRVPQSYGGGSGGAYKETIIVKVLLDKKVIATATTVEQQRYRRNNPSQRRGGNAGGQTA